MSGTITFNNGLKSNFIKIEQRLNNFVMLETSIRLRTVICGWSMLTAEYYVTIIDFSP